MERLLQRVEPDTNGGCWLWTGAMTADGYGTVSVSGRMTRAHRWAVALDGRDATGKVVMHKCDTPLCVNPAHLTIGTPADNVADMIAKGRRRGVTGWKFKLPPGSRSGPLHNRFGKLKLACKNGHAFTPENTGVGKDGARRCLACCRARSLARFHRLKSEAGK